MKIDFTRLPVGGMVIGFIFVALIVTFAAAFINLDDDGEGEMVSGSPTPAGTPNLVQQGQGIAQGLGCTACHSTTGGTLVGPTWQNLFGKTETLDDGSEVLVDEAYIEESIRNPSAKIVQGFQGLMPSFSTLSGGDIEALIAYIKSLSEQ